MSYHEMTRKRLIAQNNLEREMAEKAAKVVTQPKPKAKKTVKTTKSKNNEEKR